jgi:hypothetical protein
VALQIGSQSLVVDGIQIGGRDVLSSLLVIQSLK